MSEFTRAQLHQLLEHAETLIRRSHELRQHLEQVMKRIEEAASADERETEENRTRKRR